MVDDLNYKDFVILLSAFNPEAYIYYRRLTASERWCEELVTQVPESTRPLLRQIEAIQETTARKAEAWNAVERSLNSRLQEAEEKAAGAEERERAVNQRLSQTLSRINVLEAQISCLRTEQTQLTNSLEKERQRASESRQDYLALKEEADTHEGRVNLLQEEIRELKQKHKQELHEALTHRALLQQFIEKHNKFIVLAEIHDTKFALNSFRCFYSEIQKPTDSVFYQEAGGFGSGKYKMRPGWQLHLYISQLPCGDASLNSQLLPCLNSSTKEGFAISSTTKLNDMMEEFLESSMKNNVILGTTGRKQGTSAKGAMHPSSESTLCKKRMLESFLSLSRSLANFPLSETSYLRLKEKAEEYNSALKIFKESSQFSNWLMKPLQFEPPVLMGLLMESLSSNWEFVEMERLHHTLQQHEIELAKTKEKSGNNYGEPLTPRAVKFGDSLFTPPHDHQLGIFQPTPNGTKYWDPKVINKPVEGTVFDTLELALNAYKEYASEGGFEVRKGGQKYSKNSKDEPKNKYFYCVRQGFKPPPKDGNPKVDKPQTTNPLGVTKVIRRRKRASCRCGCNAQLRLKKLPDGTYSVSKFIEKHNHSLVYEDDIKYLRASRRLTFSKQQLLNQFSNVNIGPVKSWKVLKEMYGGFEYIGATDVDCKNYRRGLNEFIGERYAQMVVDKLLSREEYFDNVSVE
ncbi:golgin candidate 5 [Artemisia annua]|uniref:Golgin candidate 5 n=1 Tax=Artemisia annua TaxID=35608 RepID=A0A2U1KWW6_ARTAN|nr:golgin candidate 5 [Artemisia annua]